MKKKGFSCRQVVWRRTKFSRMNSPVRLLTKTRLLLERDPKRDQALSSVKHKKRQSRFSARVAPFVAPKNARYTSGIPFPTQLSVFTPTPRVCTGGSSYTEVRTEIFSDPIYGVPARQRSAIRSYTGR